MVPEASTPVGGVEKAGRNGMPFFTIKYSWAVREVIFSVHKVSQVEPV